MPVRHSGVGNNDIPGMDDINGSQEVSALYSDRFYVEYGPRVRVAFAEMFIGGGQRYHSAVAMLPENAIELAMLILRLAGQQVELKAAEKLDGAE